ncbi:MAG: peptide deformylase, partial [Balneolales bacterium]
MPVLPIVTYDDPVLRKKADPIEADTDELQDLIDDMFETMYNANGVGLAAPQVGETLRLFVVDADVMAEDDEQKILHGPMVFINPELSEVKSEFVEMEEGCLSLPELRDRVTRPGKIRAKFLDRDFHRKEMVFSDWMARVVQHEYDHIEGILFIDHLGSFRRRLLRGKLNQINAGDLPAEYPLALKE